jgi:hypothetical protein
MASQDEINQARSLVPDTTLTDEQIGVIIDASKCMNEAVGKMWGELAGHYSNLVNISEAGSSRSMGDLSKNALAMASYYAGLGCGDTTGATKGRSQTVPIVRL